MAPKAQRGCEVWAKVTNQWLAHVPSPSFHASWTEGFLQAPGPTQPRARWPLGCSSMSQRHEVSGWPWAAGVGLGGHSPGSALPWVYGAGDSAAALPAQLPPRPGGTKLLRWPSYCCFIWRVLLVLSKEKHSIKLSHGDTQLCHPC